jgi:hypothetical protein
MHVVALDANFIAAGVSAGYPPRPREVTALDCQWALIQQRAPKEGPFIFANRYAPSIEGGRFAKVLNSTEDAHLKGMSTLETMNIFRRTPSLSTPCASEQASAATLR